MPERGRLTLRASADSNQVKIAVQDTGCGISRVNMSKLFTLFFTTKEKGKGVGLGLVVAYGIIQRYQGRIEIQSKEGESTTFTIHLPLHHEEKIKVLVVDDEAIIRESLRDWLGDAGYRVLTAENGHQALKIIRKEKPSICYC